MAPRPVWKGFLKIALVTIPIKVYPATESSSGLSFNQLHSNCQSRISQKKWCSTCAREVPTAEIVKGYEFETGKYVVLLEDELDAVQPPSTKVIDLTQFADETLLHPLFVDRSYYLAPDGPLAAEAFVVMREGMNGQVGIGKLAIYGREYLVAVRQHQYTLLLHTLHHAAEIRTCDVVEDLGEALTAVPNASQLRVARQVIAALHGPLDLTAFVDQYRLDVQHLVDDKIAGNEILVPRVVETPAIGNLRDALTASLQVVSAPKKIPAKATPAAKRTRAS